MNRKLVVSILAILLVVAMVFSLLLSVIPFATGVVSSDVTVSALKNVFFSAFNVFAG